MSADSEPIHVSTGTFRIDQQRMLEKLGKFRLAEPAEHILAFCRAAVASSSGRIDILTLGPGAYELLFDGGSFGKDELKDPLGNLFAGEEDWRRGRFLAAGVLGAFQLGAQGVSVSSSPPEGPVELTVHPGFEHTLGPPQEPDERNRIRVWGLDKTLDKVFGAVSKRCARSRVPISIDGLTLGPPDHESEPEPSVLIEGGGMRGRAWRHISSDGASLAALSVYGVEAEHAQLELGPAVVAAEMDDDRLRLDAGQAKVIRDARFNELQGRLRDAASELLAQAMDGHRQRLRGAGKAMIKDASLLAAWRAGLGAPEHEPPGSGKLSRAMHLFMGDTPPDPWTPERASVLEEAQRTRWLRQAAVLWLKGWRDRPIKPSDSLKPLWTASVFLDWKGKPLSFLELRTALEETNTLAATDRPWPGEGGKKLHPVLWLTCDADLRAVKIVFPSASMKDPLLDRKWVPLGRFPNNG